MSILSFIVGSKADMPEKYLEQFYKMLQDNARERMPIEPSDLGYFRNYWQLPMQPEDDEIQLWAFENDELIGFGYASWKIKYDNLHHAFAQIYVIPEKRRRGFGSEILRYLLSKIPQQIEVVSISALVKSVGEVFLKKYQTKVSFEEIVNVVDLSEFDKHVISELAAKERTRVAELGYSFIEIGNYDYLKKVNVEQYVRMIEEVWNDMPVEELSYDREIITPERYKGMIDRTVQRGNKIIGFIVVETKTYKPVGLTKIFINKYQSYLAEQDDTGIIHEHRGNGLGLAVKYQLLEKMLSDSSLTQ
ncbi:MAG: GNAT family N-acetyltransferase, partial [Candidatus Heimdallarchaeota archaeon]